MELNSPTYIAMDTIHWNTLKSLSDTNTIPPLNIVDGMVDIDGTLITIQAAKEIQDAAHDIYLTHTALTKEQ